MTNGFLFGNIKLKLRNEVENLNRKIQVGILVLVYSLAFGVCYLGYKIENKDIIGKMNLEIVDSKMPIQKIEIKKAVYYEITEDERFVIESMVAGEAGNQVYEGKLAVANCILNACLRSNIRPDQVRVDYQYSGWYNIEDFKNSNPEMGKEIEVVVSQIFDNGELLSDEILWFYNPKWGISSFHENQKFIFEIQDHRFFGLKN